MAEKPKVSAVRRGMYIRLPKPLHEKLCRIVAQRVAKGELTNMNRVVCELIQQAKEPALL